MRIEDYWSDISLYYISFIVKNKYGKNKINRLFAFDSRFDEKEIETKIFNYFHGVESVERIDFWSEGLIKNENY